MELQQHLNLITRILKQTVELQKMCREDFILNMKGSNKPIFQICLLTTILRWTSEIVILEFHVILKKFPLMAESEKVSPFDALME